MEKDTMRFVSIELMTKDEQRFSYVDRIEDADIFFSSSKCYLAKCKLNYTELEVCTIDVNPYVDPLNN